MEMQIEPGSGSLSRSLCLRAQIARTLFIMSLMGGVAVFWLSPHPPMIDLPQHAGQITLLRDILLRRSIWDDRFYLNFLTPYFLSYLISAILAVVTPVTVAIKLLLSSAYVAFVYSCIELRRQLGGDARLDWLFLLPFFGFSFKWGFLSFLISAPIVLWFVLLSIRFTCRPTKLGAGALFLTGLLLLAAHGLAFLFALGVGYLLSIRGFTDHRGLILRGAPFLVLSGVFFGVVAQHVHSDIGLARLAAWSGEVREIETNLDRIPRAIQYAYVSGSDRLGWFIDFAVPAILVSAPWLLCLRLSPNLANYIFVGALVSFIVFTPSYAPGLGFVYERFAIFLIPAYAVAFTKREPAVSLGRVWLERLAFLAIIISCWVVLGFHARSTWAFREESANIDRLISGLEPNRKALSMVFDHQSKADNNTLVYVHYPMWYQAESGGLVDYSFACCSPQVVRYRREHLPLVSGGFEWNPGSFDWAKHGGDKYDYFIVRRPPVGLHELFSAAPCPPIITKSEAEWAIFARRTCDVARSERALEGAANGRR